MPPAAKRDISVILYDAKNGKTAENILGEITANKYCSDSKDVVKFVIYNANRKDKMYIATDFVPFNPNICKKLKDVEPDDGNWLQALHVGIQSLKDHIGASGVITLQVLLISELNTPVSDNQYLNNIIEELNSYDIYLYIIGPLVKVFNKISSAEDVKLWMKNLVFEGSNENFDIAKKIVQNTHNSVVCDFDVGKELFFSFKNNKRSQPWQVPLSLGSTLQIPVHTTRIVKNGVIKLTSRKALSAPTWVLADDDTVEIHFSDLCRGISRHGKFVPMMDENRFKCTEPRTFTLLGFTSSSNIPEYYMIGDGSYCVTPASESLEALVTLIETLAEQKKYGIVKRIYNANQKPRYAVLIPKPLEKCFMMAFLPYADDVKVNYVEKPANLAPKGDKEHNEIFDFLDSLDIENPASDVKVSLTPNMMQSVNETKIVNIFVEKYLEQSFPSISNDATVKGQVNSVVMDKLVNIWPEREIFQFKKENTKNESVDYFDDDDF